MIGQLNVNFNDLSSFCDTYSYELRAALGRKDGDISPLAGMLNGIEPINSSCATDLSFCRFYDERADGWIKYSCAGCIIIPLSYKNSPILLPKTTYVFAEYPRLALLNFINKFWENTDDTDDIGGGIHPTAKIGDNVRLGKFCVIGANVEIGADTIIGNNTTIMHAKIGQSCNIGSSVTIGGEGFGFEDEGEDVVTFPHLGGVVIGDNVKIGSSTCIDRASLGNTIIQDQVKIDNLVHVAHNVVIGRASKVIAMTIIGGSTKIGQNVWIAPGASLRDWIDVGDGALVGMGAVVTKNIDDNQSVIGNPAKPIEKTEKRYR